MSATILTGRAPEVLEAWRVVPVGKQRTLQALRGECRIDPRYDPVFQRWVEERQRAKARAQAGELSADGLQQFLKVLANSGSYGIFAEANRNDLPKGVKEQVTVYGAGALFTCRTHAPEEPGEYCFGVLAALTTGAARLMLALLERCVTDLGGSYIFCDTDSMTIVATEHGRLARCFHGADRLWPRVRAVRAISRADVDQIVRRFGGLSPYDPSLIPSILKIEDVNYVNGEPRQLWA